MSPLSILLKVMVQGLFQARIKNGSLQGVNLRLGAFKAVEETSPTDW